MKKAGSLPIKVALYGMDSRSHKTMELYLKGPCRGVAMAVDETQAEIDIIDADFATAGEILAQRREQTPERPIVLLSLQPLRVENTHFVQKPVNAEQLTSVLQKLKAEITALKQPRPEQQVQASPAETSGQDSVVGDGAASAKPVATAASGDQPKKAKKRVVFEDNEGGYAAFLGTLSNIDFNNPEQLRNASFDPRVYFLGFVLSAYKVACHENRALQLNSIWKPLLIFPKTRQIWLDADDKQLRAFAGVEQTKSFASNIKLVAIDAETAKQGKAVDKFQDMDVFVWKLTIWTSKGRYPVGLELDQPVYLKQWPNFTRLLLTPDALRLAALLLQEPRAPLDLIKVLNVKPQYVFALISACQSLGILAKSQRRVDQIVVPEPPKQQSKKKGLLSRILQKLLAD
ncbi:MAG: hypothetical protein PHH11_02565 [Methylomonas sp.]|nr:hypothetical protein [Methylomonas sp.]